MNIRRTFLAVSAIALLGTVAAAQAEDYLGVQTSPGAAVKRADVMADAVRAANAPDQNVARGSRGAEQVIVSQDRAIARAEAVRAAAAPDQNVSAGSRVNSRLVSTQPQPLDAARASAPKPAASRL
ncbi:DUF4148 domain-containing protein [Variovorax sp. UMC13]|uniref:DUF4148 domain-containing protein n=1 Tax=Variovorax sp. UMC13 TaxID=1862326 RepID=UPI0016013F66|nr:DUF4148 domain-containing protein [Variovorax sp. UMC13]MBB1599746.1 DUF4148 domain-containing protein [Variovorax sp. UMC13]